MLSQAGKEERLVRAALEAKDYRGFIAGAILATAKPGGKPNIAAISRKAGFSSRSFIGDVIDGRRRLSPASYPKLVKALGLPVKVKNYFHLLVAQEEKELNHEGLKQDQIEAKLQELRHRLGSVLENKIKEDKARDVICKGRDMLDCYAALGDPEIGATAEEIAKKTDLPLSTVEVVLRNFVAREVVTQRDGRYASSNAMLFFKDLGANEGAKACFLQSIDEMKRKANAGFTQRDRAFYQFVFSVDSARMPELKQRLWELLQEFMETHENTKGDKVAKLILGLYN